MATVSVSVSVPPVPVLPRSLDTIWSVAAPVKLVVGMKFIPASRRLMFAIVPVKVIVASVVPSPTENVRPVRTGRVIVPFVAVSWTWTVAPPASTSLIEMRLPLPLENVSGHVPRSVVRPTGRLLIGASLMAVTVMVTVTTLESSVPSFAL